MFHRQPATMPQASPSSKTTIKAQGTTIKAHPKIWLEIQGNSSELICLYFPSKKSVTT